MFRLVRSGTAAVSAAKRCTDSALVSIGVPEGEIDELGRAVYSHDGGRFVIRTPLNGEEASGANGGTLGFQAGSPDEVDAFHAAGLAAGGTAIEDPPGPRNATGGRVLYLAYLRDPAGNKICALHRLK
jgi:catechol 2,3-dioxygenase-like lactoylglutathione lyase family enzyme